MSPFTRALVAHLLLQESATATSAEGASADKRAAGRLAAHFQRSFSNATIGNSACPPKTFCFPPNAHGCKSCIGPMHAPCNDTVKRLLPTFCDPTAPITARAREIISHLTLDEKVSQLSNGKPPAAIPRLGIPSWEWWSEAAHGIAYSTGVQFRDPTPCATSFPEQIGLAASFDTELFGLVGDAVGAEARAMMNAGNSFGTFWAPCQRSTMGPHDGDARYTCRKGTAYLQCLLPGECPILTSTVSALFVSYFQGTGLSRPPGVSGELPLRASSACKHYAAYDLESWKGMDRHHFNAIVTTQDWRDTYEPIFQSCVVDANVSGIMCSANAINGVPNCANKRLLTDVLRGDLGFSGYVTGDDGSAMEVLTTHKYVQTPAEAVAATIAAGMDIDDGTFNSVHALDAIKNSSVGLQESDLTAPLQRLFAVRLRLGSFDPKSHDPAGYQSFSHNDINQTAHDALALRAATESIVLLKGQQALPLDFRRIKTMALIGPLADDPSATQGSLYGGKAPFVITPRIALANLTRVVYLNGSGVDGTNASGFPLAMAAAASADTTVLILGITTRQASEGHDRDSVLLPLIQLQLAMNVSAVTAAGGKKTIVGLISGGGLDISALETNPNISAIFWLGHPGQAGGTAFASILSGKAVPSGRLPLTWYRDVDVQAMSMEDMTMRPNASTTVKQGRTYRWFAGTPLYRFGEGETYNILTYPDLRIRVATTQAESPVGSGISISRTAIDSALGGPDAHRLTRFNAPVIAVLELTVNCTEGSRMKALRAQLHSAVLRDGGRTESLNCPHSALLFASAPGAGTGGRPLKTLAGFARKSMGSASEILSFNLTALDLSVVHSDGSRSAVVGDWQLTAGLDAHGDHSGPSRTVVVTVL